MHAQSYAKLSAGERRRQRQAVRSGGAGRGRGETRTVRVLGQLGDVREHRDVEGAGAVALLRLAQVLRVARVLQELRAAHRGDDLVEADHLDGHAEHVLVVRVLRRAGAQLVHGAVEVGHVRHIDVVALLAGQVLHDRLADHRVVRRHDDHDAPQCQTGQRHEPLEITQPSPRLLLRFATLAVKAASRRRLHRLHPSGCAARSRRHTWAVDQHHLERSVAAQLAAALNQQRRRHPCHA